MKFKKIFLGATAALGTAFVATSLTSCSKEEEGGLKVCLASTPQHVDPALNSAVDGACYAVHAFSGLVRYVPNEQGDLVIAPDLCKELPTGEAVGTKTKYLIPASGVIAAAMIILANILVENIDIFIGIPTGIFISIISVPYFLYLLIKSR
jgi:hypothetical protein